MNDSVEPDTDADEILYGQTDIRQEIPQEPLPAEHLIEDAELQRLQQRLCSINAKEIGVHSMEAVLIAAGNAAKSAARGESSEYANIGELIRAQDEELRPRETFDVSLYKSGRWILEELDLLETGKSEDGSTGFKITPKGEEFLARVTKPMWDWLGMPTYDNCGKRIRPRRSPRE